MPGHISLLALLNYLSLKEFRPSSRPQHGELNVAVEDVDRQCRLALDVHRLRNLALKTVGRAIEGRDTVCRFGQVALERGARLLVGSAPLDTPCRFVVLDLLLRRSAGGVV